jgi:hypothetical protein
MGTSHKLPETGIEATPSVNEITTVTNNCSNAGIASTGSSPQGDSQQRASCYTAGQIFRVPVPLQEGARIDSITSTNKVVHRFIL